MFCMYLYLFEQIKEIIWSEWVLNCRGKLKVALTFFDSSRSNNENVYNILSSFNVTIANSQLSLSSENGHRRVPLKYAFYMWAWEAVKWHTVPKK